MSYLLLLVVMVLHLLLSGAEEASLCGSAVDVIGSSGADLLGVATTQRGRRVRELGF